MEFLKRVLKVPGEDQDEGEDEFNAEQSGLLMVPSLPGGGEQPSTGEGRASPDPQAEAEPAQADVGEPQQGEADPLALASDPPPAERQAPQAAPEEAPAEQDSGDDALALFRASASKQALLPSALTEGVEEMPAADLLAEARSVRNKLLGKQAPDGGQ